MTDKPEPYTPGTYRMMRVVMPNPRIQINLANLDSEVTECGITAYDVSKSHQLWRVYVVTRNASESRGVAHALTRMLPEPLGGNGRVLFRAECDALEAAWTGDTVPVGVAPSADGGWRFEFDGVGKLQTLNWQPVKQIEETS